MRLRSAALLACAWFASTGLAFGQSVDRGTEVTVNPIMGGGNGVLLYPGGQYMRTVQPALQPGETARDMGAIRLHMPAKRPTVARRAPAKTVARAEPLAAPEPPAKPQPTPKAEPKKPAAKASRKAVASAAPPQQPAYNPGGYDQGAAGLLGNLQGPPVSPPQAASPPSATRMARTNPPPASAQPVQPKEAPTPGLSKRSVILFAPQAADPAESALGAIKFLAGDLNAAMSGPSSRVQLQAYGGNRGDKGSDARRLSLKRALAIRQVLIDNGVSADRIDVRAMGGVDDTGPADRVDVFVKA
jgi:outer membrane protein OmpA-like peptidoglycan-associated protein